MNTYHGLGKGGSYHMKAASVSCVYRIKQRALACYFTWLIPNNNIHGAQPPSFREIMIIVNQDL